MAKIYYGFWSTVDGNHYCREPFQFHALREARKTMREIAQGNNTGNGVIWHVHDQQGYDRGCPWELAIAKGRV